VGLTCLPPYDSCYPLLSHSVCVCVFGQRADISWLLSTRKGDCVCLYGNMPVELCQPGESAAGGIVHDICELLLPTSWNTVTVTVIGQA